MGEFLKFFFWNFLAVAIFEIFFFFGGHTSASVSPLTHRAAAMGTPCADGVQLASGRASRQGRVSGALQQGRTCPQRAGQKAGHSRGRAGQVRGHTGQMWRSETACKQCCTVIECKHSWTSCPFALPARSLRLWAERASLADI